MSRSTLFACAFGALFAMGGIPFAANAQKPPSAASRNPNQVIEESLSRIFDGRETTPAGDRRSLILTPAEHAAANNAGRAFNTGRFMPGYGFPEADIYDPRFPAQANEMKLRLQKVVSKYGQKEILSPEERNEIGTALIPFLRQRVIAAQLQNGQFVVPPKTKCRYNCGSICMDKSWPAPRSGEKMQLVPVETLLPDRLADVYKNVIRRSARGDINSGDIQGLTWTLRQIAQDIEGKKPVTISERQRHILNSSMPNGYAVFEAVRRPMGRSSLPKELEKLVRDEVNQAIDRQDETGAYATRTISDEQMSQAVDEQMARLRAMPVDGPIPDDNSHYTQLAPGVYARASYGSLDIQIANSTTNFYLFKPENYAGQSERQTQRMGPFWQNSIPPQQPITEIPQTESVPVNSPVDRIIFVNGINTSWSKACCEARALHCKLKVPVTLAYNENLLLGIDQLNALEDWIDGEATHIVYEWEWSGTAISTPAYLADSYTTIYSQNTITKQLIPEIVDGLQKGQRIGLIGHSEGTIIISESLAAIVKAKAGDIMLQDTNGHQISASSLTGLNLNNLSVVLAGGQSASDTWLTSVGSTLQLIHDKDPIAKIIGSKAISNSDAILMWYASWYFELDWVALKYHDFMSVYYPHIGIREFHQGLACRADSLTHEPDLNTPCK